MTYELVGQPAHGEALKVDDGILAYIPAPDWSTRAGDTPGGTWQSDVITYRAFDGMDYSNPASYRFWVAPINDPPTFTPGQTMVEAHVFDPPVSVPWATDVLAGPPNESAQAVTFVVTTDTRNAPNMFAVPPAIDGRGVLTFTPGTEPGLGQRDCLRPGRRRASRTTASRHAGHGPARRHQRSRDVRCRRLARTPAPPVAADDALTVNEDESAELDVLANDHDINGDPMLVGRTTDGEKGTAALIALPGTVRYTPRPDATGEDTFTYTVITDGAEGSNTGTVHVTILPANDAPVAVDDTATVAEGAAATPVDVLGNDSDVDGDVLTVTAADGAGHGVLSIAGGAVTYAPDARFTGTDGFAYTVSDGHGGTSQASVQVTVAPDETPPVVTPPAARLWPGTIGASTMPVRLTWTASDAVAGVASYDVQERIGTGGFRTVLTGVTATAAVRTVRIGTTYGYRLRATDRRGNTSDWSAVTTFVPRRYEETTAAATWVGRWSRSWSASASGGRSLWTASTGRRVTFAFRGRSIGWVGRIGPGAGRAEVRIDGVRVAIVSQSASTVRYRSIAFRRALATAGPHTIQIRPLGNGRVDVDAFLTLP